ncbi:hypothetical protein VDGD_01779 [Verticillium dahliae]|nr:hypothetical protein VdG1_07255 [Verticillium dahliae VDG1]RBQ96527.1 hypothetical protein VDGD_01779 [Verticillium dahliae]
MAKAKKKPSENVQNRQQYTRINYLHQAAAYLAVQNAAKTSAQGFDKHSPSAMTEDAKNPGHENVARRLVADISAVSKKVVIRPTPAMRRTVCKACDAFLIEGHNCTTTIENLSKQGRKPWADVMVMKCHTCGHAKRFPVNCPRQKRRALRGDASLDGHVQDAG